MTAKTITAILVPGAWMGAWIWSRTAQNLTGRGFDIEAITLRGLEPGQTQDAIAGVRLEDHVQDIVDHISAAPFTQVILVSHSYSAIPTAMAADRRAGHVRGLIHLGGFLPVDGRSLLDDWGDSSKDREQERRDIVAAGGLWKPPGRQLLDHELDLAPADRDFLAERFTPHPGLTVTEPARLSVPVQLQPTTYVTLSSQGGPAEAWAHAPKVAKDASNWRRRHLESGHWPMTSAPERTAKLIAQEIRFYSTERG